MLPSNWKCTKWVEISGYKMDWTFSVWYGLVVNVQNDEWFGLSWTLGTIFKICSFFFFFFVCLEIAILKKIATFGVFYCVVHLPVHVRTKNM